MISLGVLGCGNMGGALLRGFAAAKEQAGIESLYAYNRTPRRGEIAGVNTVSKPEELFQEADYILIAVKPHQVADILRENIDRIEGRHVIISIAAGLDVASLKNVCECTCPVIRVMPNTPALIGQGAFGVCFDDTSLNRAHKDVVSKLFATLGKVYELPENKFNAFSAVAGCGPAYVFAILDAMIEAGVSLGLSRTEATDMVYATAGGSVALAEQSGEHLCVLREQVSSPAGMTIAGLNHMDRTAIRGNLIDAILAAYQKGKNLSDQ